MRLRVLLCLPLLLCLAAIPAPAQAASTQFKNIDVTWLAASNPNNYPVCPATAPKACVVGYIETLTDPTGSANTLKVAWGTLTGHFAPGSFLLCGDWPVTVKTDYFDDKGVEQTTTAPLTGTATVSCPFVPPSGPSGPLGIKVT